MSSPADPHRVMVLSVPDESERLTSVLMSHLQLTRIDARVQVRNLPGFCRKPLSSVAAQMLVESIRAAGVYAISVPESSIPDLARPTRVHRAVCTHEGVDIYDVHGEYAESIFPEEVELLSMGAIQGELSSREVTVASSLVSPTNSSTSKLDLPHMMRLQAFLIARNPTRPYFIVYNEMNYEYLEDRLSPSAAVNFKMLADDIASLATDLYQTPQTRAVMNEEPLQKYRFDDIKALRNHTLFHLMICRQMRKSDG